MVLCNGFMEGCACSDLVLSIMFSSSQVFFVIRMHSVQVATNLGPIIEPDPPVSCDLMDGRDAFLTIAREKHYEFSSLRRAKYSTMALLYELHNQGKDNFVYTCNNCKAHVETRYHCTKCEVSTPKASSQSIWLSQISRTL